MKKLKICQVYCVCCNIPSMHILCICSRPILFTFIFVYIPIMDISLYTYCILVYLFCVYCIYVYLSWIYHEYKYCILVYCIYVYLSCKYDAYIIYLFSLHLTANGGLQGLVANQPRKGPSEVIDALEDPDDLDNINHSN